jgi:hypothetical protein
MAEQPRAPPDVVGKECNQLIVPQKFGLECLLISSGLGNQAYSPRESRKD